MKKSFAIVGCGKVGTTLACHLTRLGYPLAGLSSKSLASAEQAGKLCQTDIISTTPRDVTIEADIVFITTPDGLIQTVCDDIAEANGFKTGSIVMHCSGSLPSTILSAAKKQGAHTGSAHPLQSFPAISEVRNPFKGSIMSVEGDDIAVDMGLTIAKELEATGHRIKTDAKTMYHASAVVASNCLVTIVDFAYNLLASAGISRENAYDVLGPLIEGTLANIKKSGPVNALTGPVVRGDTQTVVNHLTAIGEKTPDLETLYKVLGDYTARIAIQRGTLDDKTIQTFNRLFKQ